jgi:pimeloyl-ACP methyl ester carboxylesterase
MQRVTDTAWSVLAVPLALSACAAPTSGPDLGALYNEAAQKIGDERNPVIVIPGVLGSKLESAETSIPVWGAFVYGAADADTAEGARLVALPMEPGTPLSELHDDVVATEVLDTLTLDIGLIRGVELGAYVGILRTLGVGNYRDETLGISGAVDYGGGHYTCFQFAYDWRRDISEQAAALHERIMSALAAQPTPRQKVDVCAHSMGGLVLRYYLRYGPDPLPEDGSLPELDWEGAQYIERAILIGTPSGGSSLALEQLVEGVQFASLITPKYRPAVLGTMPAIYQLLPRTRHARIVDEATGQTIDLFEPKVWIEHGWGLADPGQDRILRQLLPEVDTPSARRAIALEHLAKCLQRAEQLHRALDVPAAPPEGTTLHLIAGDTRPTPDVLSVNARTGTLEVRAMAPGDNTVSRVSALMDERTGGPYQPRLRSPISFDSVQFLTSDHLGLTNDPLFGNFVLYTLLEQPREDAPVQGSATR